MKLQCYEKFEGEPNEKRNSTKQRPYRVQL